MTALRARGFALLRRTRRALAAAWSRQKRRQNKPERKLSNRTSAECQSHCQHWRKNPHDYPCRIVLRPSGGRSV
jgi:hypothetical protein